ncbi:MAG: hypothetical protein BGO10_06590 [Chlamydia sp. 32-24]|nr:MAG: hypothetical protein BGO10_06590 [Chlamydia sp. 32-24]
MTSINSLSMYAFPEEIVTNVFSNLNCKELFQTGLTCKKWQRISSEVSLWKKYYAIIDLDYDKSNKTEWKEKVKVLLDQVKAKTLSSEDFSKLVTLGLKKEDELDIYKQKTKKGDESVDDYFLRHFIKESQQNWWRRALDFD